MDKLMKILHQIKPFVDFMSADKLIDGAVLDSLDVISLVGELNDEFDISISVEDLVPDNFNSAKAMCALIQRLQDGD